MAIRITKLNAQTVEEATAWFIDFNEGQVDPAGQEEFDTWLRRSPEHVRAFLQVSALWEDADTLNKRADLDMAGLIARARAEHNVLPLELVAHEAKEFPRERRSIARISLAFAAVCLLGIGTSLTAWYLLHGAPTYATEIGEQRAITLEDGSTVELNSRSRIRLRFSESERMVELIEGQALFKVEKDRLRPFVVTTGETSVRAVGTQFDVYRKRTGTVVTVVEGRVAVTQGTPRSQEKTSAPADGPAVWPGELLLAAGEQAVITSTEVEAARPANIAVATAWTDNKLMFESTPLREVVEEFNRYNRQQLVIQDPELHEYHISGIFPSTDSSRMLDFLRKRFGVAVSRSGERVEISRGEGS